MVKRSPTLGTRVCTKTKCIKLIFIGKITLIPVAFLMALSICSYTGRSRPRTEDLMLSGRSFIKIRIRIGPKTDPWGTPDN